MATIKDVAKEAGVAVETVSRVLNNRGYISDKTRNKVYEAMKSLNYTPNTFAQGLSKKNMDAIAVIVPHVEHPFFSKVISRLEKEISRRGYRFFLYNSSGDIKNEEKVLKLCESSFMTGALLFSADYDTDMLKRFQIPIVLVERKAENDICSVCCDNKMGGRLAASRLIEDGCKSLLIFNTGNIIAMPGDEREKEFVKTAKKSEVSCKVYRSSALQYMANSHYDIIKKALLENPSCDGIFATSDVIAAQVIQVCDSMGKRIPKDIKLVGFDDVILSTLTTPSITTIRQPVEEIASLAVDVIEKLSEGKKVRSSYKLPVELIERQSG
ncbi:MAG: LacI family transcriptional regulator [Lachnospiraceae bacterium]|nr:LacI family transcriptional regulator [Lachnospiraceae bacterium]